MVKLRWSECMEKVESGKYLIDNCIVELAFAAIGLINMVPISIFLARIFKRLGFRESLKAFKVWMLIFMILLNLTILIAYAIDFT